MYRFAIITAVMVLLVALAASVGAYPSLNPWTGTGNLPTAEVQKSGTADLAVDFLNDDSYFIEEDNDAFPARLVWGAGKHLEVGAGYLNDYSSIWHFAAKYQIKSSESGSVAIGALYSTMASFEFSDPWGWGDMLVPKQIAYQAYIASTFRLGKPESSRVKATVGANWTTLHRDAFDGWDESGESAVRLFASLQARYGKSLFAFDYQSSDTEMDQSPMWSLVGRYDIAPNIRGELGYGNAATFSGGPDNRFFGGICFTLGNY